MGIRGPSVTVTLVALLVASFLASIAIGAYAIPVWDVVGVLSDRIGLGVGGTYDQIDEAVIWDVRLPRAVLAALVGASLGIAGAALQAIFRNPLADPSLIGVTGGAAVGATFAIVTGFTYFGLLSVPVAAALAGLVATLAVYAFARRAGRTEVVTLILTGLAVNAVATAAVGMATYVASPEELQDIVFWTLGSLGGASWETVRACLPFVILGIVVIPLFGRTLDLMVLGEREAGHLGVRTEQVRLVLIVVCAVTAGAGVAVAGIIGFVGLIVPHIIRLLVGPGNRLVVPLSAVGGATLLLLADLAARTVAAPAELPLGVLTAALGGPFFLFLVHRTRGAHGGWG